MAKSRFQSYAIRQELPATDLLLGLSGICLAVLLVVFPILHFWRQ